MNSYAVKQMKKLCCIKTYNAFYPCFISKTNLQMPHRYRSGLVNKLAPFIGCSLEILSIDEGLDPLFDHGWLRLEH